MKEWRTYFNEEMMADKVAKEYMTRAEEMKAAPYFTSCEEEIVLFHEGTLIEGDIRAWLKKHEVDTALKNWKALKVSGQLPKQIPILAKENMAICHSLHGWSSSDLFHLCNLPSATD